MSLLAHFWIWISLLNFFLASSDTIKCNTENQCKTGNYTCHNDTTPCDILCTANDACYKSTFKCPSSSSCNITCASNVGEACEQTHFHVYESQSASLRFSGQPQQFNSGYLQCDLNSICEIQCGTFDNPLSNSDMCRKAEFHAQNASKLKITVLGIESLTDSFIYCPERGDCIIDILNNSSYALTNIDIFINDPKTVNLQIYCHDGQECYGTNGDQANAPALYCYSNNNGTYQHECKYVTTDGKHWRCDDLESPCNINSTWITTTTTTPTPNTTSTTTSSTTLSPNTTTTTSTTMMNSIFTTFAPTKPPHCSSNNNGGNNEEEMIIIIVVIALIVLLCIAGGCYLYKRYQEKKKAGSGYEKALINAD